MANNYSRLKDEADIESVIDLLGIETHQKGAQSFILCPIPAHSDSKATNCYFKPGWNNCFCTVCQKSINAIDLIMYTKHCDFGEAAEELWELEGRPDWYKDESYKNHKSAKKETNIYKLERREADLIDFFFPGRMKCAKNIVDEVEGKKQEAYYQSPLSNEQVLMETEQSNFLDFMSEKEFKSLVINLARRKYKELLPSAKFLDVQEKRLVSQGIESDVLKSTAHVANNILKIIRKINDRAKQSA